MKVENNFIYRLTDRIETLAVIPLGEKGFSLDFERQNEDKLSYEKKTFGKNYVCRRSVSQIKTNGKFRLSL